MYVDVRRIVPLLSSDDGLHEINAILIFKYLMQEVAHTITDNVMVIYGLNEFDTANDNVRTIKEHCLTTIFERIYLEFDGKAFSKPTSLTVSEEEVKSVSGSATLSKSPSLTLKGEGQKNIWRQKARYVYFYIRCHKCNRRPS